MESKIIYTAPIWHVGRRLYGHENPNMRTISILLKTEKIHNGYPVNIECSYAVNKSEGQKVLDQLNKDQIITIEGLLTTWLTEPLGADDILLQYPSFTIKTMILDAKDQKNNVTFQGEVTSEPIITDTIDNQKSIDFELSQQQQFIKAFSLQQRTKTVTYKCRYIVSPDDLPGITQQIKLGAILTANGSFTTELSEPLTSCQLRLHLPVLILKTIIS